FCDEGTISLLYYEGSQPTNYCDIHQYSAERDKTLMNKLGDQLKLIDGGGSPVDSKLKLDIPGLDLSAPEGQPPAGATAPTSGLLD
ncbi:MAG: hypothetical protein JNG85_10145, partial [Spirochaetaceae bacterium]|nr:hypothetical protein [Spirochaetaceae bacterium]